MPFYLIVTCFAGIICLLPAGILPVIMLADCFGLGLIQVGDMYIAGQVTLSILRGVRQDFSRGVQFVEILLTTLLKKPHPLFAN